MGLYQGSPITSQVIDDEFQKLDVSLIANKLTPIEISTSYLFEPILANPFDNSSYTVEYNATALTALTWDATFSSSISLPTQLLTNETLIYTAIYDQGTITWHIIDLEVF